MMVIGWKMIDPDIIKFTNHALLQMRKRNITREEVFETLNDPDEFKQGTHSNETIAIKRFGRRRVRVIYVSDPVEIRVITATL